MPMSECPSQRDDPRLPPVLSRRLWRAQTRAIALYEAVSEGRRIPAWSIGCRCSTSGWITLFDYLPRRPIDARSARRGSGGRRVWQIADYYDARKVRDDPSRSTYKPLPPRGSICRRRNGARASSAPQRARALAFRGRETAPTVDRCGRAARAATLRPERNSPPSMSSRRPTDHLGRCSGAGKRSSSPAGPTARASAWAMCLPEHGLRQSAGARLGRRRRRWPQPRRLAVLGSSTVSRRRFRRSRRAGYSWATAWCGRSRARRRAEFPRRGAAPHAGDLVVHVDHGIGRFVGLKTIDAAGAPHDCLELHYARRRQALPAGRKHRASDRAMARTRARSSTGWAAPAGRSARPDEEAHPRHGGRAHQDRRRAAIERRRRSPPERTLRRILRALSL